MQKYFAYHFKTKRRKIPLLLVFVLFISSCNITKNIPQDQYLLDKAEVVINEESKDKVRESELSRYVRQKPNKRVLMFRLHLRLFNMANPQKSKGISGMLRKIGEEPVVLDTFQTKQTVTNLEKYLELCDKYYQNKGEALISDELYESVEQKQPTVFDFG